MKIFWNKVARNFEEAVEVAYEAAGVGGLSMELIRLFESAMDTAELRRQAEEEMRKQIQKQVGKDASWQGTRWLVPVAKLHFEAAGPPQLEIECQPYLVGVADVRVPKDQRSYSITVVGTVGKPLHLRLPLQLLRAILDGEVERFPIVARDSHSTSWRMPAIQGAVRLPNEFMKGLTAILRRKPVANWLEEFGPQGCSLAPLVVGALIGLQLNPPQEPPPEKKSYTYQRLHDRLAEMGYSTRESQQMLGRATFDLKPGMTEDEALEVVLRNRQ
ncbi:MAG: hypothetical protein AAB325_00365 [Pseudomonadota bacterium]